MAISAASLRAALGNVRHGVNLAGIELRKKRRQPQALIVRAAVAVDLQNHEVNVAAAHLVFNLLLHSVNGGRGDWPPQVHLNWLPAAGQWDYLAVNRAAL